MKITSDINIRDFEFWSGARDTADILLPDDFDAIQDFLDDCYPNGVTDTELNDFLWFQRDEIAKICGFVDWDDLSKKRDPSYKELECPECGAMYDADEACFSPVTRKYYCDVDCCDDAEADYFDRHPEMTREHIPEWAVNYLVNGSDNGLAPDEIDIIRGWMESIRFDDIEVLKTPGGNAILSDYNKYPAFGLPCCTYNCLIKIRPEDETA